MEHLLETLNKFWKTFDATQEDETNGSHWFGNEAYYSDLGRELENELWDKLFETYLGSTCFNSETKKYLINNGYRIWVGDRDSFGILVVCISKDGKNYSIG